jgi:GH15 family glucan-1,4-alpha-glucosidase
MAVLLKERPATGKPGIEPRWTRSDKQGVRTAYSASSRVWFTISKGILNEVYHPTIDRPQIRDLQYLVTDGETFFCDERHLDSAHAYLARYARGFRVTSADRHGRFRLIKEIIADPHNPCVLLHTRLEADRARFLEQWRRASAHMRPVKETVTGDGGCLYHTSHSLILAHEDKLYGGAMIASLSIPWGEYTGDNNLGGYHLVWTRDMCHSAIALLAAVQPRRLRPAGRRRSLSGLGKRTCLAAVDGRARTL